METVPSAVIITLADRLYIPVAGLSNRAQNELKRLAAFRNPQYYHSQAMRIVDECHHVPAVSFEQVLKAVQAKYIYGLTATSKRQDGHHPILSMYLGCIRYHVDVKQQAEKRPFAHILSRGDVSRCC